MKGFLKMNNNWTTIIKPKTGWFDVNLKELLQYKDLIIMFVKRDFKTLYKQIRKRFTQRRFVYKINNENV